MQIAGTEKMGYYPTPSKTLSLLCGALSAGAGSALRILDPCVGEGEALAAVAATLRVAGARVTTYGVDLSPQRAAQAKARLDHVIAGAWADVSARNGAFSLLLLNPPYDFEAGNKADEKKRQEYLFLRQSYEKLCAGGVLLYLIPRWVLGLSEVARFLAGHFGEISIWRLPDGEFDRYKQIVVLGRRKPRTLADDAAEALLLAFGSQQLPPSLDEAGCIYQVPESPAVDRFFFHKSILSHDEALDAVASHGVLATRAWQDLVRPPQELAFRPVMPLRRGHLAMLLASGLMGTVALGDIVAKGKAVKVSEKVLPKDGEEEDRDTERQREKFVTRVYTLDREGNHRLIDTQAGLEAFLEEHGGALARLIEARHRPLYDGQPQVREWTALGRLLPHKLLPGRPVAGLLDAQKHVAIAAARAVRTLGYSHIVAEMGFGKSAAGLAVTELNGDWPALVLCPSHLVEKWARETADVVPGVTATIVRSVGELQSFRAAYRPGEKRVAVLSKEYAKLGSGWQPSAFRRYMRGDDGILQVWACPRCGGVLVDGEEVPILVLAPKRQRCPRCGEPLYSFTSLGANGKNSNGNQAGFGEYLKRESAIAQALAQRAEAQATGAGELEVEDLYPIPEFPPPHRTARWPLSRYIRGRLPGFFRLLIADEVQAFKGKATDQGAAFQDLINACAHTLTLTGTIFGGKSTSLFWLLYRLDHQIREDYGFHDETRWAAHYGRLERIAKKAESDVDGAFSGRRRYYERAKEIPGIAPQIVARILPSTVFARITDLGYSLPPYAEEIVRLEMTEPQAKQYAWLDTTLQSLVAEARERGDLGLISVWLQNVLARPNSGFRLEGVSRQLGKVHVPLQALQPDPDDLSGPRQLQNILLEPVAKDAELLPKEAWLASYCQAEAAQGRKVLVYVRQTASRDIQPRLVETLTRAGLRTIALPDSVEAVRREAWIAQRAADIDVLLTNPKKVETGLDLIAFATVVFFEIEYSLYTLWQAMRRVWRLGQTRAVKVVYAIYHNTMEEAALALMGQKLKAALLLYGDNAASAIADEAAEDDGDLLAELAARVLARENLTADGLSGLLQGSTRTTTAPWGSYTQESVALLAALEGFARVLGFADAMAAREALRRAQANGANGRTRGQRGLVPLGQTSFFDLAHAST
jgi:hypothetical protein